MSGFSKIFKAIELHLHGLLFVIFVQNLVEMSRKFTITLFILLLIKHFTYAQNHARTLFENGILPGNYGYSLVTYSGYSWIENVNGRMPLIDTLSFTPPNALSLKYTSSLHGNWETYINFPEQGHYLLTPSDEVLSLRTYLMEGFNLEALPQIALQFQDTCTKKVNLKEYLVDKSWKFNEWMHIRIPLSQFGSSFNKLPVKGIVLFQQGVTGVEVVNHMLIDQIEFGQANYELSNLNYPAVLNSVTAFERHVDIEWQLPLDPSIRYVKIYRSVDGKEFEAVAVKPIQNVKYTDVVPVSNRNYYYKISWLDFKYVESPTSGIKVGRTKPMSNDDLMTAIQAAHVNYFDKMAEFNSGMHKINDLPADAIVNVEETGYSLLASTVGVSKGWISNRIYLRRVSSIVDFLKNSAEQFHGVYPTYLDGRTGKGVYGSNSEKEVSVPATASLMQGLLVARTYLEERLEARKNEESEAAAINERIRATIEGIDEVWRKVEWTHFAPEDTVLMDSWSPKTGFAHAKPLGGFGPSMMSYFMAFSSPTHALSEKAYARGFGVLKSVVGQDSITGENIYHFEPLRSDTILYGYYLNVGKIDQSLMDALQSFLAFNPNGKKDQYANYGEDLPRLIRAYKRRDNELNIGNISSDIWGTQQSIAKESQLPILEPALAISSYAFTTSLAERAARRYYEEYGKLLFTEFGFRTWMSLHDYQVSDSYKGINQAAIPVMIENGRTGLIWNLFMKHEDISRMTKTYFKSLQ